MAKTILSGWTGPILSRVLSTEMDRMGWTGSLTCKNTPKTLDFGDPVLSGQDRMSMGVPAGRDSPYTPPPRGQDVADRITTNGTP